MSLHCVNISSPGKDVVIKLSRDIVIKLSRDGKMSPEVTMPYHTGRPTSYRMDGNSGGC